MNATVMPQHEQRVIDASDRIDGLLAKVRAEVLRAVDRNGSFAGPHEGYAVILEELDELWDEVKADRGRTALASNEALQVAAMGIRYMLDVCGEGR